MQLSRLSPPPLLLLLFCLGLSFAKENTVRGVLAEEVAVASSGESELLLASTTTNVAAIQGAASSDSVSFVAEAKGMSGKGGKGGKGGGKTTPSPAPTGGGGGSMRYNYE